MNLTIKLKMFLRTMKFYVILIEQMKTPWNLIFNKCAREIIGYDYLRDTALNHAILEENPFTGIYPTCSITILFKFSLANHATSDASASQIFLLLWKAISICELNSFKVLQSFSSYLETFWCFMSCKNDLRLTTLGN